MPPWVEIKHDATVIVFESLMGGGGGGGIRYKLLLNIGEGDGDSSVVRAPGLVTERSRVQIPAGAAAEFFFSKGRLSVLTLIPVAVPPPCYRSSTYKIPVILPKSAGGRLQLNTHTPYVMWLCMK